MGIPVGNFWTCCLENCVADGWQACQVKCLPVERLIKKIECYLYEKNILKISPSKAEDNHNKPQQEGGSMASFWRYITWVQIVTEGKGQTDSRKLAQEKIHLKGRNKLCYLYVHTKFSASISRTHLINRHVRELCEPYKSSRTIIKTIFFALVHTRDPHLGLIDGVEEWLSVHQSCRLNIYPQSWSECNPLWNIKIEMKSINDS